MPHDQLISHYRVLDLVGGGGMGEVYLGHDETLRRRVALKAIRPEHRLNPDATARFRQEARILSQLDHPHICRIYDFIETPERDWIVLEFIEGQTLHAAIKKGLRDLDRLRIAQQIAAVLVATHAAGVIHRDLKPQNVMLTPSGDVKVLDFGLSATASPGEPAHTVDVGMQPLSAAEAAASVEETRWPETPAADRGDESSETSVVRSAAGVVKGTIAYMSPEQARGEVATSASDMYSFGLLLQELFTGEAAHADGSTHRELLEMAQRGESRAPVGVAGSLTALIARLKALPPAQRPTAVDTLERLRWIADGPRRTRRNLLVATVLLAAILGAIKYTVDLSRERNAALAARDEADQRRGQAEGLISFMVGDLRTKLAAVGRLEILDDVGKQALTYFASVPADQLTGEELHRRSQALHQLGQVRQARADLPGALKAFEDSLAQATEVVRRDPDNAVWQLALGTSHFYVGDFKLRRGSLDAALAHFRAYQAIAQQLVAKDPDNFEWSLELSYGHSNVAAIHSRQGDLQAARVELEKAAAIQTALATKNPTHGPLLRSLANGHNRLGIVLDSLGEIDDAIVRFRQEGDIHRQVLVANPNDAQVRRRLEVNHIFLGAALRAQGQSVEASREIEAAVREGLALVSLDATNTVWQRDLAVSRMHLARFLIEDGRPGDAVDLLNAALAVLRPLAAKNPSQAAAQRDVARAQHALAEARLTLRDARRAEIDAGAARDLLSTWHEKNPKDPDFTRDLALAENLRGRIFEAKRDHGQARDAWTRAEALLAPLARASSDRTFLDPWVRALLYLGRKEEAQRESARLTALGYQDRAFVALTSQRLGLHSSRDDR